MRYDDLVGSQFGIDTPRSSDHDTRLCAAVRDNYSAKVVRLLDKGADPNAVGMDGLAPLHIAARDGTCDLVKLLLARGADPNLVVSPFDQSQPKLKGLLQCPVQFAFEGDHYDCVAALGKGGADLNVDAPHVRGRTLAHQAVLNNDWEMIQVSRCSGAPTAASHTLKAETWRWHVA
eukprot:GDKH01017678.1.p1 GENE.GDKH01017678.1~~GDKH01017678.1.p1  ORF type:complete len:176 (+),score=20.32 GDKH01017678.1:157-684(+)